jgi:molecular chaperone DnaK (HSP70)
LVHENTAAATMYAINHKIEEGESNRTVLFYNMGGMDTEVSIVRYSNINHTKGKTAPYMEILSEAYDKELGSSDIDLNIVNILADRFNALPEREGKVDIRTNVRAIKRLLKDSRKIKEILSANKASSVKIPELADYVTLKFNLKRTEVEEASSEFYSKINKPIEDALS